MGAVVVAGAQAPAIVVDFDKERDDAGGAVDRVDIAEIVRRDRRRLAFELFHLLSQLFDRLRQTLLRQRGGRRHRKKGKQNEGR